MMPTKHGSVQKIKEKERLFNKANAAWDRGDLQKAFALFMQSAKLGDVGSQIDLGYFFDHGLFVEKNKKEAIRWYQKAYIQGSSSGANNLATIYRDLGDIKKMLWWFRRAAAMGDVDVLLALGRRYETGEAVPKNLSKAREFYDRVLKSTNATRDDKAEATARLNGLRKHTMSRSKGSSSQSSPE